MPIEAVEAQHVGRIMGCPQIGVWLLSGCRNREAVTLNGPLNAPLSASALRPLATYTTTSCLFWSLGIFERR